MILRTATTLGLLAALTLANQRLALAQPEAPTPTLQIQPDKPAPAKSEAAEPAKTEAAEPAKTEAPLVVVPPKAAEAPAAPMPPVAPAVPHVEVAPVAPPAPYVEVAPAAPFEEEWHIAIMPLQGCQPHAPAQANAPDIRYYREVYEAIPFSRAEFEANPSYRHDSTMEILFGYLRPVRGQGQIGTSLYYPIQSPPVVGNPAWGPHGGNFGRLIPGNRFGNKGYFNLGYGPLFPQPAPFAFP